MPIKKKVPVKSKIAEHVLNLRRITDDKVHYQEMVDHPNHYHDFDYGTSGIECIKALRAMLGRVSFIDWLRGEIFTYNWRLIRKELPLQDAKKIKWYSNLLEEVLSETDPIVTRGRSNG